MADFISKNPFSGEIIGRTPADSSESVEQKIAQAALTFASWSQMSISERCAFLDRMSDVLSESADEMALLMTTEMGKPLRQSKAEVLKSALVCRHYARTAADVLADVQITTDAAQSFVRHEAIGPVLAIMPWNFPFWQVFRCLAPALAAGNTVLLKHASNVQLSAKAIGRICRDAGLPDGVFQLLHISGTEAQALIVHPTIKAVTLTGSNEAGEAVGRAAGAAFKPVVLELGGSNAFIVDEDADLDKAVKDAILGRFQNNGQSCIAAKRILVHENLFLPFCKQMESAIKALKTGNPADESVDVGPLVSEAAAQTMERQMAKSLSMGAQLVCGGYREGAFFAPTLAVGITSDMPLWRQETFGPVAVVRAFRHWDEAVRLSNETVFGLGVSIYTASSERILARLSDFEEASVFINSIVKSDPRLPFGGVKASGIGRELGPHGLLSFVNVKTVYVA